MDIQRRMDFRPTNRQGTNSRHESPQVLIMILNAHWHQLTILLLIKRHVFFVRVYSKEAFSTIKSIHPQFHTLPSIFTVKCLAHSNSSHLNEFNIKMNEWLLIAYCRFNVAEIGAMSRDIPHEARILVKRMRSDPNVDMQRHWKIIKILVGPNHFCLDFCYQPIPERTPENHRKELIEALRILRDNMPRTIVNLVTPPSELSPSIE